MVAWVTTDPALGISPGLTQTADTTPGAGTITRTYDGLDRLLSEGSLTYGYDAASRRISTTSYTYEPFGRTTVSGTSSTNPFRFTGREEDSTGALSLYHYRARYYSPTLQRFLTEDPIGHAGGDANLYGYVGSAPTVWTDPWGLVGWPPIAPPYEGGGFDPVGWLWGRLAYGWDWLQDGWSRCRKDVQRAVLTPIGNAFSTALASLERNCFQSERKTVGGAAGLSAFTLGWHIAEAVGAGAGPIGWAFDALASVAAVVVWCSGPD
jgi:RHS repeat-associated protein